MFIEITPTTSLPTFEAYLDGNGGTETADGNDNNINQATQFDYLDGNYQPIIYQQEDINTAYYYSDIDNSMPTELSYSFPRPHSVVCGFYADGELQQERTFFDGNLYLFENTMFHTVEGDGDIKLVDGNAPRESVPLFLRSMDIDIATLQTGEILFGALVFRFPEFSRIQMNNESMEVHFHYGPTTMYNRFKPLAGNIAFVEDKFDYSIDTGQMIDKVGYLYPNETKHFTDINNYNVITVTSLTVIKGEFTNKVIEYGVYEDEYGFDYEFLRILPVAAGYQDGTGNVYSYDGTVIAKMEEFATIAVDLDNEGEPFYLYNRQVVDDMPESLDGEYITAIGHEEYKLKGVILFEGSPHWAVLRYVRRDYYFIESKTIITEELSKIRNKELKASIVFNKELTT